MKIKKTELRTLFRQTIFIALPLGIASVLLFKFFLDETTYVALIENNLTTIYAAFFLAAFFATFVKPLSQNQNSYFVNILGNLNCKLGKNAAVIGRRFNKHGGLTDCRAVRWFGTRNNFSDVFVREIKFDSDCFHD